MDLEVCVCGRGGVVLFMKMLDKSYTRSLVANIKKMIDIDIIILSFI